LDSLLLTGVKNLTLGEKSEQRRAEERKGVKKGGVRSTGGRMRSLTERESKKKRGGVDNLVGPFVKVEKTPPTLGGKRGEKRTLAKERGRCGLLKGIETSEKQRQVLRR